MIEPQIGEIITVKGVKYITKLAVNPDVQCDECCLWGKPCMHISCTSFVRKDNKTVVFKKIEEMEVKIQIPDNCELIKDGDTYIVKKKKQKPSRSWEEFCDRFPRIKDEYYIKSDSTIGQVTNVNHPRCDKENKNICTSKEEAEAFLALMQLRQLRKAWVGDWKPSVDRHCAIVYEIKGGLKVRFYETVHKSLSFPTIIMAEDFLNCFKDLCETAKILL